MRASQKSQYPLLRFMTAGFLLLSFGLMLSSAVRKSPAVDEQSHLFRGAAYVMSNATHFLWGHPLLASAVSALPLLTEPDLRLPLDEPTWAEGDWALAGDAFLWRLNPNPHRLVFLGRLPTMWITLLLGALLFRWGSELAGKTAGLLALPLLVLDPNVIAHGRLVTSDVPLTFWMTLAVYGYWRWLKAARNEVFANYLVSSTLLLAGIALGAAAATKFNAALLLPALALMATIAAVRRHSWQPLLALLVMGAVAWFTVWAVYRFAWRPLPGGAFWLDLRWQFDYLARPHGAYLAGRYHPTGWWYYFPVAFLVKTPLPVLLLFALAILRAVRSARSPFLFLLLPPLVYFALSLASPLNIGYRHLLPLLPFLALFSAAVLALKPAITHSPALPGRLSAIAPYLLTSLVPLITLATWPDYIPYFNLLAGGPEQRWRILSDSNVDWGQDLPALADWQRETGQRVKLSYFGTARPSAYGIHFDPLPTWAPGPEQANPARQSFNPADPAPGSYAISVTNLHGLVLGVDRDTFAWFRDRTPLSRIGDSIFIYRIEPRGEPVHVGFAGLRPAELDPSLHTLLGTNDVHIRWFDARTSLVWPSGAGWLALAAGQTPDPALRAYWPSTPAGQKGGQSLYRLSPLANLEWEGEPADLAGQVTFLGYRHLAASPGEIALLTAWRVIQATGRPLKIFLHALDAPGAIVAQWDGLDVDPLTWQPGDVIIQLHRFSVPPAAAPATLAVGLYDGETLERLSDPQRIER